jgi:hypothetical protein
MKPDIMRGDLQRYFLLMFKENEILMSLEEGERFLATGSQILLTEKHIKMGLLTHWLLTSGNMDRLLIHIDIHYTD